MRLWIANAIRNMATLHTCELNKTLKEINNNMNYRASESRAKLTLAMLSVADNA